eukprot:403371061
MRFAHFDLSKFKLTPAQIQKIQKYQSPININETSQDIVQQDFKIQFDYKTIKNTRFQEIDSTLRLHDENIGTIKVTDLDGKGPYTYKGYEIRFNGPSEHRLNDKNQNMEMQIFHDLVDGPDHENYDEKKAVISVLFKLADKNHPVMEDLRTDNLDQIDHADFGNIFKEAENQQFYHYKGTLTVPPTHSMVNWYVLKHVLPIQKSLLQNLESHCVHHEYFSNFCTIQPLYGRKIAKNFK